MRLLLHSELQRQVADAALAALPRECCGLIEGCIDGDVARIVAVHAAKNISEDGTRFEIDPEDHIRVQKSARANGREIVGCYHSHPNGRATPSERDGDSEDGFIWLIAAVAKEEIGLSAFRRFGGGWERLEMAEPAGKAA